MKKTILISVLILGFTAVLFFQTGCRDQKSSLLSSANPLKIIECKFAGGAAKPEQISDTYNAGDRVWILYSLSGFTRMPSSGENAEKEDIWIREDLMITQEDGTVVFIQPSIVNMRDKIKKGAPKIVLDNNFTFPGNSKKGKYKITLLVTDLFTLNIARQEYTITLF
ncbi:MAG: hypothetical protein PHF84_08435 [bacterium]|nr:hypothetical protein [bacterium]